MPDAPWPALASLAGVPSAGLAFLPEVLFAAGALAFVKRHYVAVMRLGGGMLVVLGLLLVTGVWNDLAVDMRVWVSS